MGRRTSSHHISGVALGSFRPFFIPCILDMTRGAEKIDDLDEYSSISFLFSFSSFINLRDGLDWKIFIHS